MDARCLLCMVIFSIDFGNGKGNAGGKGFSRLESLNPWPSAAKYKSFPQGPLTLAPGGPGAHAAHDGRNIVLREISSISRPVLLELGVFLGGSMHRWLEGNAGLRVVGVDPFTNVSDYVAKWIARDARYAQYKPAVQQLAQPQGSYDTVVSTLWRFQRRACLIMGISPQVLPQLSGAGLQPDVVYFDNDKSMHDLWVAHTLWPKAVLAGDDWGHQQQYVKKSPVGNVKRRQFNATNDAAYNVCEFAIKQGFWVEAKSVTWMLHKGVPASSKHPSKINDACRAQRQVVSSRI